MIKSALLSEDKIYRYSLSRIWNDSKPYALFIGLNPSTADEKEDDPTIRRCITYAQSWGYGGLMMVNLFAYRATLPSDLKKAEEPIGVNNDANIKNLSDNAGIIVVAWGNNGHYLDRDKDVLNIIKKPMCLKINKSGQPGHPLYQRKNIQPIPYKLTLTDI